MDKEANSETIEKKVKIVSTEGTVGGKPRIDGTRISVVDVVQAYEQLDYTIEKIAYEYGISVPQTLEALKYYYENPEEIREQIREDKEFIKSLKEEGKIETLSDFI
ncbi:MAG: DUF433 domain-containing protein [Candidatus Thermoplasmatota archaeon]